MLCVVMSWSGIFSRRFSSILTFHQASTPNTTLTFVHSLKHMTCHFHQSRWARTVLPSWRWFVICDRLSCWWWWWWWWCAICFLLLWLNSLESKGNYSATSNDTKSVHWLLMGAGAVPRSLRWGYKTGFSSGKQISVEAYWIYWNLLSGCRINKHRQA